ncbi:putative RDD family membrane protein YckC [Serinibacter salmoneus]|uniref:Putative RDD family membrane protein YckC n=1 Tax=Serinibacter salmoneus TaxID=556530 RepID=A0A2A9CYH0_9MICO|nr:putative RDD family membrane protein YckC [Serinibacter salmoneus]
MGQDAPSGVDSALLGRRVIALLIDWAIASAISAGFFDFDSMATLGVFAGMTALLAMTLGATIGHRICGLRLVRHDDGASPLPPLAAVIRTALMCLVIPAVVWGADGRGLHDIAARTAIVRW